MRKNISALTFLFFLISGVEMYCTTYYINGIVSPIVKKTANGGTPEYLYDNSYTIGTLTNNIESKTYRALVGFDLRSIPVDETITNVWFQYKSTWFQFVNGLNLNVTLVNAQLTYFSGYDAWYKLIGESRSLFSSPYNMSQNPPGGEVNNADLTNAAIANSLDFLTLGVFSSPADNYSIIKYDFKLVVETQKSTPRPYVRLIARNNMSYAESSFQGITGQGLISVDGAIENSPYKFYKLLGQTANLQTVAGQKEGNRDVVWADNVTANKSYWKIDKQIAGGAPSNEQYNQSYTTQPAVNGDDGNIFTALYRALYNITLQRQSSGGGKIKLLMDGVEYPGNPQSLTKQFVEKNKITLQAQNEIVNGIDYRFQGWKDQNGNVVSANPNYEFYPEYDCSYKAVFVGYPNAETMNVLANLNQTGQAPTLTWTDNPSDAVSYKIYGQTIRNWNSANTITYPEVLLSTVPKGVQYYSYSNQAISGNTGIDMLKLRVYPYYNTEGTGTFLKWYEFFFNGEWMPSDPPSTEKKNAGIQKDVVITKYAVANYPNPFNPTTVINYQVPEAGHITLKVYDVMGKEIATLIDGVKTKGSYNVNFSMEQYHLASGIYFCRLQAGKNVVTSKMILSK